MVARPGKLRAFCLLLPLLASLAAAAGLAQPAFQVKDLNTTRTGGILPHGEYSDAPASIAVVGTGTVFFTASDEIHGAELWRTDGTEAGTRLVADICPGSCESIPQSFMAVGELLFFLADDGLHGLDLWKSDGTSAGTALIKDVRNDEDLRIQLLAEIQGALLFSIGQELWRSDGTAEGTSLVTSIPPGSSGYLQPLASLDGEFFFTVGQGSSRTGLWITDGTASGTALLKDISLVPAPPGRPEGAAAGGKVFFSAWGQEGAELWASDGTESGTALVKDIVPGAESSSPTELTALGEEVFFFAAVGGGSLWKSDGTAEGTVAIKSIYSHSLTARGDRLFFFIDSLFTENSLWTSDGTTAGTVRVQNFTSDRCFVGPFPLTDDSEDLWLYACDWDHAYELWKSDGTPAGTSRIKDINPGISSSDLGQAVWANGLLYFRAQGGAPFGRQLWISDGTEAGTRMLRINDQASGFSLEKSGSLFGPRPFFDLDGTLLFTGDLGGLSRSDGTAAGTFKISDAGTGEFNRAGDTVFFSAGVGNWVESLWKTDGTPEGTLQLYSVDHWFSSSPSFGPRDLVTLGDELLFIGPWPTQFSRALLKSDGTPEGTTRITAAEGPHPNHLDSLVSKEDLVLFQQQGVQLWKSDGTEAGTTLLHSLLLPFDRLLEDVSALRDRVLFFAGWASASGEELWRTDGTVAGTYLLSEIVPGPDSKRLGPFAVAGTTLFFVAGGHELWKNDAAGTALVRSLPGDDFVGVRSLTPLGGKVYFTYDDGEHGHELWVSNGTEAGTRMVEDILPGAGSSHPRNLHVEGSILVFSATDGVHSVEPWRSDGTAVGTRMLQDIAPGGLPSSPVEFTASGPNIYFAATDGATGFELWAIPRPALLATFADVQTDHWAWRFIEAFAAGGFTYGCSPDSYCPNQPVKRQEAAVFLLLGAHGVGYVPPPGTGTRFVDVPASLPVAGWIEQFAAEGFTIGCTPSLFCPESPVTRAEMAVFLLLAKHGAGYQPPPVTGVRFTDVPSDHWAAAWIEQLASEGITGGCDPNQFCPERAVTRAEMATLLATTFGLPLPPPPGG
ncbi:MAG TPA: ELWxxDGT repeat protein [Thermoanaerobaculia bacterium]